jgi:LysM repeat protein
MLGSLVLAACGGGGGTASDDIVGSRSVPTATYPAELPTPLIVGSAGFAAAARGSQTYTVEAGDTPSAIASRNGITVAELFQANGLASGAVLRIGQRLRIPAPVEVASPTPPPLAATATPRPAGAPTAAATPASGRRTHTVQSGEFAGAIAARYGITTEELARANGLTVAQMASLRIGQELIIP